MFKGTSNKIVEEKLEKGIDGVTAISDIPEGYSIEMENVDLSQPGVVKKRAGYNLWGCQLPVRTKQVENTGTGSTKITLDVLPIISCNLTIYKNTGAGSTVLVDSIFKNTADEADSVFVSAEANEETITSETIFEITDTLGVVHYVQPLAVFVDGSGNESPKFLLPRYVTSWLTLPLTWSDTVPVTTSARICDGYALPRVRESDINRLSIASTSGKYVVRIEFTSGSLMSDFPIGTAVVFENRLAASTPISGFITVVSTEYVEIECQPLTLGLQELETHYFSMRYFTGKSLWYKSKNNDFSNKPNKFHPNANTFDFRLTGCSEITVSDNLISSVSLKNAAVNTSTTSLPVQVQGHVTGYYAAYSPPSVTPFEKLTYLCYSYVYPTNAAIPLVKPSEPLVYEAQVAAILSERNTKNPSCKLLLSTFGYSQDHVDSGSLRDIAKNSVQKAAWIAALVAEVVRIGFDGVDMDWEGGTPSADGVQLFSDLRAALNAAGKTIMTAAFNGNLPYNPVEPALVQQYLNHMYMMNYDMGRDDRAMPNAPLGNVEDATHLIDNTGYYGIEYYVAEWKKAKLDLTKCIMGFPLYSYIYVPTSTTNNGFLQPVTALKTEILYKDILALGGYTTYYDVGSKSSWKWDGTNFISFDDVASATAKVAFLKAQGLGGMFFWQLNGDAPIASADSILKTVSTLLLTTTSGGVSTITKQTANEVGFLYGTDVDVGYVGLLNKYFDVDTQRDRVLCGYDGSVFVEDSHLALQPYTITSLKTGPAQQTIAANKSLDTFTIPLAGASSVYLAGDVITISFATDTAGTIVTSQWIVSSATISSLIVAAKGNQFLLLPPYTRLTLTRTSDKIYLASAIRPITKGMTVQYGETNSQNTWYVVKEVDFGNTETENFIVVDSEITWSSDVALTVLPIFLPVYPSGDLEVIDSSFRPRERRDYSSVTLERNVVIATGLSGMWRFNGDNLLNMRIPIPAAGYIRNLLGSGGSLRIDANDDGTKYGRFYTFFVTYSYQELVNGKLIRYESALNTIGCYSIYAEPAVDGSDTSQYVELQIPTIPNGIGLPASDMLINVYRTQEGAVSEVEGDTGIYLKEIEAANNPDVPFITVLAGTAPKFSFTETQYDLLPVSFGGDKTSDETQRRITDVPLATLLTTLENRVVAANGADQPYVNIKSTGTVFSPTSGSFEAHGTFALVPPSSSETTYSFVTCPVEPKTTAGTNGGGNALPFDVFSIDAATLTTITITDNSHLFDITSSALVSGTNYLLRHSSAATEETMAGVESSTYYDGFGFERQVFKWNGSKMEAEKKWVSKLTNGNPKQPSGTFEAYAFLADVPTGSAAAGLMIGGDRKITLTTSSDILSVNDVIILKGLGTTGLLMDAKGTTLNWDYDIIATVTTEDAATPRNYTLSLSPAIASATAVLNAANGNISPAFSIYKRVNTTERTASGFTLSPTTAAVECSGLGATPTAATPTTLGDFVNFDGLPSTALNGFNMNGSYEVATSASQTNFTVKIPSIPATLRGTVTHSSVGKVVNSKTALKQITDGTVTAIEILTKSLTTTTPIAQGDWVFMIGRGAEQSNYSLQVSGWFQVHKVKVGAAWVTSAAIGAAVIGIQLVYADTLDYFSITGLSETKLIVAGSSGSTKYIPIPVPTQRNILGDVTGTMFGPSDGYTPLEKIIKRLCSAINTVLHSTHFAYWGKFNSDQSDQNQHPPVNGLRIHSHMYPDDKYKYHYASPTITSRSNESKWKISAPANYWKAEGNINISATTTPQEIVTMKRYRPSRIWWTNPITAGFGQAFRELSVEEVSSQDGEQLLGISPFQSYAIFAKKSSLWRGGFSGGATLSIQKIPSTVGASSAKNMVPTEKGVFLLHDSGLYITDGGSVEPVLQVSRYFNSRAVQNVDLFPESAGHHNPLTKTVYIGVPLSDTETETTTEVSSQFVFNYSLRNISNATIDSGWSVNTNFPATAWVRVQANDYFASSKGKIFRLRTEKTASKYSDEVSGIPFKVTTRYIDSQDPIDFKFYRSIFFQFGKETSSTFNVSMTWDFGKDYTLISTFQLDKEGFGEAPFGTSYWGCDRYIETMRRTPIRNRLAQISLKIEDSALNSSAELYGIFLESSQVTTKLHSQNKAQ